MSEGWIGVVTAVCAQVVPEHLPEMPPSPTGDHIRDRRATKKGSTRRVDNVVEVLDPDGKVVGWLDERNDGRSSQPEWREGSSDAPRPHYK